MNFKKYWFFIAMLSLTACGESITRDVIEGETMGTYYKIDAVNKHDGTVLLSELRNDIEALLAEINASQSTWQKDSVISRFNEDTAFVRPFAIDDHFVNVMLMAQEIFYDSGGAFNPALAPVIKLWGFDTLRTRGFPDVNEISDALALSDFRSIEFDHDAKTITRTKAGVSLNFSAIAKGYAVDAVARLLVNAGIDNFLVDIGGEIYAKGLNEEKRQWRIAIQIPNYDSVFAREDPHFLSLVFKDEIMHLSNMAIATSGDYRNFRFIAGKIYSHIIDPRTGDPTQSRVASASVISRSTAFSDAWATALMVMGPSGIDLCNQNNMACMVLLHTDDGTYQKIASHDWLSYYDTDG